MRGVAGAAGAGVAGGAELPFLLHAVIKLKAP